jgi:hypothetical protein
LEAANLSFNLSLNTPYSIVNSPFFLSADGIHYLVSNIALHKWRFTKWRFITGRFMGVLLVIDALVLFSLFNLERNEVFITIMSFNGANE